MIRGEHGIQCMLCSCRIIIEMLSEIQKKQKKKKKEKCDFLKSIIDSSTIEFSVIHTNENSQHVQLSATSIIGQTNKLLSKRCR